MKAIDLRQKSDGFSTKIPPEAEADHEWDDRTPQETRAINAALNTMTHPKSIAVVGAMRPRPEGFPGMFGCIKNFGYRGKLYPINPNADEIAGIKAYPNLASLPEPVDLVVVTVPAPLVAATLRDCAATGNKNIHIFTSGFKETGEPDGMRMHAEMEKIARKAGLRVIGPNCMGFYVPSERVLTWTAASKKSGPVAFVTQSGGHAQDFTHYAHTRYGINFSKAISYGNALTLDSTDFLEFLRQDEETRIIAMYLEGVKNGRKLLKQITEINRTKPVIIMKGGLTESGARAVASHTGSMAGGEKIWGALFRQTGAVRVNSLEEMADTTVAFLNLPEAPGRRVAVIGTGGGVGVAAADSCALAGLDLPALPPKVMKKLREFIPPAGNMIRNPIDAHIVLLNTDVLARTLEILADGYIDMFVISLHIDWLYNRGSGAQIEELTRFIAESSRKHTGGKPLAVVWRQFIPDSNNAKARAKMEKGLLKAGVPVYEGLARAVAALSKLAGYYEFQRQGISKKELKVSGK